MANKPQKTDKPLLLLNLPLIVRNQAIRYMSMQECLLLTVISKKSESAVKWARIKVHNPSVHFCENPRIELEEGWLTIYLGVQKYQRIRGTTIRLNDLKPWLPKENVIRNKVTMELYEKLRRVFIIDGLSVTISVVNTRSPSIVDLFSTPTLRKWKDLFLYGRYFPEEINMIMRMASKNRSFELHLSDFPQDFRHKNAFRFREVYYEDARWVSIEDLLALKNAVNLKIGQNHIRSEQWIMFIDYWMKSSMDMFKLLHFVLDFPLNFNEILQDYVFLRYPDGEATVYMTLAKETGTRKNILLTINLCRYRGWQHLNASAPDKPYCVNGDFRDYRFKDALEILILLEEKNELEKRMNQIDRDRSFDRDNVSQLRQLMDKLINLHVTYVDGLATVN